MLDVLFPRWCSVDADPAKRQQALLLYIRTWKADLHQKLARAYWTQCEKRFSKRLKKAQQQKSLVATLRRTLRRARAKTSPRGRAANPILKPPRAATTRKKAAASKNHSDQEHLDNVSESSLREEKMDFSSSHHRRHHSSTNTAAGSPSSSVVRSSTQRSISSASSSAMNPILRSVSEHGKVDPRERTIYHATKVIQMLDTPEMHEKAGGLEKYKAAPAWSFVVNARYLRGSARFAKVQMAEAKHDFESVLANLQYLKEGKQPGEKRKLRESTERLLKLVQETLERRKKPKSKKTLPRAGRLTKIFTSK